MRLWRQDKWHGEEVKAFVEAVRKRGPSPLPFDEIVELMKTTLQLAMERK